MTRWCAYRLFLLDSALTPSRRNRNESAVNERKCSTVDHQHRWRRGADLPDRLLEDPGRAAQRADPDRARVRS